MSRFIDVDRIDWRLIIPTNPTTAEENIIHLAKTLVERQPTADVTPVVHGEWVKDEEESKEHLESIYICSACHNFEAWGETEKYNYCPNCGARMDGAKND